LCPVTLGWIDEGVHSRRGSEAARGDGRSGNPLGGFIDVWDVVVWWERAAMEEGGGHDGELAVDGFAGSGHDALKISMRLVRNGEEY
jgi:hypothetical protein